MDVDKSLPSLFAEWWDQRRANRRATTNEAPRSQRVARWMPNRGSVIFTLLVVVLLLWAQTAGALPLPGYLNAPDAPSTGTIAYQGRLADANGNPLTAVVNMEFRLYNAATGGTPLWSELWTGSSAVQVSDGLFNVMLGSLEPISQNIMTGNSSLWLGITAGTDDEMMPRVQLGSVPFAVQALTVPDGSVTAEKLASGAVTASRIADGAVSTVKIAASSITADKLDSTSWVDLVLASGYFTPPNSGWQRAQYRRVGDIVYLRGTITSSTGNIADQVVIAALPPGFRPPKTVTFVCEPHGFFTTKHRVDIATTGDVVVSKSAGATAHVSLDGIFFGIN